MNKLIGFVIGTKSESHLHKGKQILEIEIQYDTCLLNWQNKKVLIEKITSINH